jgi:hypothetical protein
MINRLLLFGCTFIILVLSSCASNNEEELYPCVPENVTYSGTIAPIIQQNCFACHGGDATISGIPFNTYENLKVVVDAERLIGALRHLEGFAPMPQASPALPECEILKIEKWVNEGALNN